MSVLISELRERLLKLSNTDQIKEFLKHLEKIQKTGDYTFEEELWIQLLKSISLMYLGLFEDAVELADDAFQKCIELNVPQLSFYALMGKFGSWMQLSRPQELSDEDMKYCEKILNTSLPLNVIEEGKGVINFIKGWFSFMVGKMDLSLEQSQESLRLLKKIPYQTPTIPYIFTLIGYAHYAKGEHESALMFLNKALESSKGDYMHINTNRAMALNTIGEIYYQRGKLDEATEYFKKSLELWIKYDSLIYTGSIFDNLIKVSLFRDSPKQAEDYLHQFKQYLQRFDKKKNSYAEVFIQYKLAKGRLLVSSTRTRDKAKGEKILMDLIYIPDAVILLCHLFLEELRSTNDLNILDDIQPLIENLHLASERSNSYSLLAYTNLLQGKLSLLKMNIGDARQHLTHAQRIAEEHDLQLLAQEISREHDILLEQIERLQNKKLESSISDRLNLDSIDEILDRMQGKRALQPLESTNEKPIFLLIMGRDGVSYFNYSFVKDWTFDDIFSSFMSAFNSFSSEIFAKNIDRVKIDENLILISPVDSFFVCYVIKGQSYLALQKLTRFSDAIKWNTEISEALKKSIQTGEELDINNPASLGTIINEIFND
ncbi:MAG: tetratricopeptide repeat protein [Promethearchaeota archaeon]|jgi:tetratricopeptide (TPR) repeat protein